MPATPDQQSASEERTVELTSAYEPRRELARVPLPGPPGKIEISTTKPTNTQRDFSLAYSPGVAAPCLEIDEDPDKAYSYTTKDNLVGVVSTRSAVLGLGDIGTQASKPVMEGKGVLFKRFADIDVFDIELDQQDLEEIIDHVDAMLASRLTENGRAVLDIVSSLEAALRTDHSNANSWI